MKPLSKRTSGQRPAHDPVALALGALAWVAIDPDRLGRMLVLTGLAPTDLKARAMEPATLAAVLVFLEGDERDLLACADALEIAPAALVALRHELER